ncbi:MAG: preprotein translocase subunit SecG [Methylocystis sp.]|nr:preprotein translocase subunit SecG [Methylocystis sp.]
MQQVIIAIHLMVVVALVILVLYQKSEGGALGMGGGQGSFFTGRGQANALTRATGILATIFFLTSIALTVLPAWERHAQGGPDWSKAVDQGDLTVKEIKKDAKPAEEPKDSSKDTIFDQLRRAQEKRLQSAPVDAPAPVTPPPAAGAPEVEAPKVEAPKTDVPKPEAPKAEEPALRPGQEPVAPAAPKDEAPKVETPAPAEAPKAEAPVQWKSPTQ